MIRSKSVCTIGSELLDRFAIEVTAISAPGVIRIGWFGGLEVMIEGLGIDDFGLAGGFVEDGVD
jgi:hypothetical protein